MSVADYGPSSQTLTFLDPEDDLGSLGIGADTQVDTFEFDVTCKSIFPSLSIKKIDNSGRWLRLSLHPAESVPAP